MIIDELMIIIIFVYTHVALPQLRFIGNATVPVMGVVLQSINLSFSIDNAFPDVVPAGISWTLRRSVNNTTIVHISEQSNNRYTLSSDRRSLMISNLTFDDAGQYTITATNIFGSDNYTVSLFVKGKYIVTLLLTLELHATMSVWKYEVCS